MTSRGENKGTVARYSELQPAATSREGGFDMLMVTRYNERCSCCYGLPLQHATLLAATGRGKPSPLCVNLGETLRNDIKRILRTQWRRVCRRQQLRV